MRTKIPKRPIVDLEKDVYLLVREYAFKQGQTLKDAVNNVLRSKLEK